MVSAARMILLPFLIGSVVLLGSSALLLGGVAGLPSRTATLLLLSSGLLLVAGLDHLFLPRGRRPEETQPSRN